MLTEVVGQPAKSSLCHGNTL